VLEDSVNVKIILKNWSMQGVTVYVRVYITVENGYCRCLIMRCSTPASGIHIHIHGMKLTID
jgi:hypothetical protein